MMTTRSVGIFSMVAVMACGSSALAGTKIQMNIVPANNTEGVTVDTCDSKGKVALSDKGKLTVQLSGVVDPAGTPVTSAALPSLQQATADSYIGIARLSVSLLGGGLDNALTAYVLVPVALKGGKGKSTLDLAGLFVLLDLLPGGARTFGFKGLEVWGPIGAANLAACNTVLDGSILNLPPPPEPQITNTSLSFDESNLCRMGTNIGIGGVHIPCPAGGCAPVVP